MNAGTIFLVLVALMITGFWAGLISSQPVHTENLVHVEAAVVAE